MVTRLDVGDHGFFDYRGLDDYFWPAGDHFSALTIRQSAQIAEASYSAIANGPFPEGWEKIEDLEEKFLVGENENPETAPSFSARVFVRRAPNGEAEAIIGFAGLQKITDLFQCAKFALGYKLPIWEKIDRFVNRVFHHLKQEPYKIDQWSVRVLGHSLGGSIAHLVGARYNFFSLSIDGLGVKQLIEDPEKYRNEDLATTVAIVPNAINQAGTVWGKMIYVLPEDTDYYGYQTEIYLYFNRFLRAQHVCSTDEGEKKWLETDQPARLALFSVEKTVELHAISNFTCNEPDINSAREYLRVLKEFMEGAKWKKAKSQLRETLEKGLIDFKDNCEFLVFGVQYGHQLGAEGGRNLASNISDAIGSGAGTVIGAVGGSGFGAAKGFGTAVRDAAPRWFPSKQTWAYVTGGGTLITVGVFFIVPGLQPAALALLASAAAGTGATATVAAAGATAVAAASAGSVGAAGAIAAAGALAGAGGAAAVAALGIAGEGLMGAADGVIPGFKNGAETGAERGKKGTDIVLKPVLNRICALGGAAAGTVAGIAVPLHRTVGNLVDNGTDVVCESRCVAFFLLFFHLQPKISKATHERLILKPN